MDTKSGDAKVAAAGGNGGEGGKIEVNFNPEMVPGRSRVTAVYRTRATKGGRDGSGVIRFEGDPRDLREVMPDPAFLDTGAAERAEADEYRWLWPLVSALVGVAAVVFLVLFLVGGCESDKSSTVPGTTTIKTETTFTPAQPATAPAPQIIAVQGANGQNGRDGQNGATGPMGPQGLKGDKGDTGDVGLSGSQGPQGEPGADGAPGKNGRNGKSGSDGAPGAPGDPGQKGDPGEAGARGQDGLDAGPVTIRVIGRIQGEVVDDE